MWYVSRLIFGAIAALACILPAHAQKHGGILTIPHIDTPPSPSIQEEGTASVVIPFMAMYNNLVIFDQHIAQHKIETIRPELATEWTWSADGKTLTFALRDGVKWHDGKPFTSADVKCTWDMVSGLTPGKIRKSPRQAWFGNLAEISVNGDREVTFHLKRPQPSFIALLASGWSPVYPCHVPSAQMRTKPVGTGPFRFVEYRLNESIQLERNPDYWKKGLPYLDGIEYSIIPNRSTAILAFVAGKFDVTFPFEIPIPLVADIKAQAPTAVCEIATSNASTNLLMNSSAAPFDNPAIRRAMALVLDRKAFVDILSQGQYDIGGAMLPPPEGIWGLPPEMLRTLPGYGPDVARSRAEAVEIMRKLGYGPEKPLKVKISTRNIPLYRDPAVILIDQLKAAFIEGELDVVDTAVWFAKIARKDFSIGLNVTGSGLDEPDQQFYENYACGSQRNYTSYCNAEVDALIERQSMEADQAKRREIVWQIDRRLQEDGARPIVYHGRSATCWQPRVKNMTIMVNSVFNGWRFEDVWLEK